MPQVALKTQAPEFELPDFTGKPVRLSQFQGHKIVLLVFNRGFV